MKRVACAGLNVDAPRRYGTAGRLAAVLAAALFLTVAQSGPVRAQQHLAEEPGFGLMLMDQGEAAHELVSSRHINLQETLAEALADKCLERDQVVAVRVATSKLDIYDDCAAVGYEIVRVSSGIGDRA